MTIHITPEIEAAYRAYLDEQIDADFVGKPIRRRDTYPYVGNEFSGMVSFAAGFQAGSAVPFGVPAISDIAGIVTAIADASGVPETQNVSPKGGK